MISQFPCAAGLALRSSSRDNRAVCPHQSVPVHIRIGLRGDGSEGKGYVNDFFGSGLQKRRLCSALQRHLSGNGGKSGSFVTPIRFLRMRCPQYPQLEVVFSACSD